MRQQRTRVLRLLAIAAVVAAGHLALAAPAPAADFLGVILSGSMTVTSYVCSADGTSTIDYTASGNSTGSRPGTFTASGTFTIGPQDGPGYPVNNFLPAGVLGCLTESLSITSSAGNLDATASGPVLPPPGFVVSGATPNTGTCLFATDVTLGGVQHATGWVIEAVGIIGMTSNDLPGNSFASGVAVEMLIDSSSNGPFQASSFGQSFWGTAPPDTAGPTITVEAPAEGATYTLDQPVAADYMCFDTSGIGVCSGDQPLGGPVDTSTAGAHTFSVSAVDGLGNPSSLVTHYTVLAGSTSESAAGGDTVTTDPGNVGATAAVPVQTSLTLPSDASTTTVAISGGTTTDSAPAGFSFFGNQVTVDTGGATANASDPYVITFSIDASQLGSVAPTDVQVFRDGVALLACSDPVAAIPDACVAAQSAGLDGDALITIRTTHFSRWNFGRLVWAFTGFLQPVDNVPTVNTLKAGAAVPVKFSLGGNKGLNVFQAGSPSQTGYGCDSSPTDQVEQTVTAGSSSLTYDAKSGTYTYAWKTEKAWAGSCRELTLKLRDGTIRKAHFQLLR
jgi:hypothetical protein